MSDKLNQNITTNPAQKREKLYHGITDIRDDLADQAREPNGHIIRKPFWKKWYVAAAVLVVVAAGIIITRQSGSKRQMTKAGVIVKAEYPKTAPYPNEEAYYDKKGQFDDAAFSKEYDSWWEDVRARRELTGYEDGLDDFLQASTRQFLSADTKENRVYSPLNVFMALGMLAELTDGESRRQILDILGSKDIGSLRKQASDLWNANYCDDGAVTSILAGSLWLDQDVEFIKDTMESLAKNYYASSYQGEMGSEAMDKLFQNWLNEQTGGLLEEQVSGQELDADTVLALAATIYFRAKWSYDFSENMTEEDIFHTDSGDVSCDFMHKEQCSGQYYWGERFSAVSQSLNESGSMWFVLPDEGVSAEELLADDQAMEFLLTKDRITWEDQKQMLINLAVPKFDVVSKIDLREGLQALGITDVFDGKRADFSPMTTDREDIFLSSADHAARVSVDEEGVTAAAYTVMQISGSSMPMGDEIDFVLDRPFLFAVTGSDGLPLFVGVVEQP